MSKEEILNGKQALVCYLNDWQKQDVLNAMQEFADQEKEKIAVAFSEWKDENTNYDIKIGGYRILHIKGQYAIRNLCQYFINNVYNQ